MIRAIVLTLLCAGTLTARPVERPADVAPPPAVVRAAEQPVKMVFVRGHTRNGRYVAPHWRAVKARR